jgi:hypothetical protein
MQVVVDQPCRAPNLNVVAFALSGRVGTFLPPRDQKVEASCDERSDKHPGQAEQGVLKAIPRRVDGGAGRSCCPKVVSHILPFYLIALAESRVQ